jgi:hypothetical protein
MSTTETRQREDLQDTPTSDPMKRSETITSSFDGTGKEQPAGPTDAQPSSGSRSAPQTRTATALFTR